MTIYQIDNINLDTSIPAVQPQKEELLLKAALVHIHTAATSAHRLVSTAAVNSSPSVDDYAAELNELIEEYLSNPSNLTVIEKLIALLGSIPDSDMKELAPLFAQFGNMKTFLDTLIENGAAIAFANGDCDPAKAIAFLEKVLSLLPAKGNSLIAEIKAEIASQEAIYKNFPKSPKEGDKFGDFVYDGKKWVYHSSTTGEDYDPATQADLIAMLLAFRGINGNNTFWDTFDLGKFENAYMSMYIEELIKKYGNNPALLIALLCCAKDNSYQDQLGQNADTTDDLSNLINKYITPLETLWSNLKDWDKDGSDAKKFFDDLNAVTDLIKCLPSTSGFKDTWMDNVYNQIMNSEAGTGDKNPTIEKVLEGIQNGTFDYSDLSSFLQEFVSGDGTAPSSPAYQMIVNALQQGGALVSQQSKTVGSLASAISNMDDQALKLFNALVDAKGTGLMAMVNAIVNNFKSN